MSVQALLAAWADQGPNWAPVPDLSDPEWMASVARRVRARLAPGIPEAELGELVRAARMKSQGEGLEPLLGPELVLGAAELLRREALEFLSGYVRYLWRWGLYFAPRGEVSDADVHRAVSALSCFTNEVAGERSALWWALQAERDWRRSARVEAYGARESPISWNAYVML